MSLLHSNSALGKADSALGRAVHGGLTPRRGPLSPHDGLERETQKWVAQTFFGTLLKQMHEGPFHSKMLDGGRGGQAFTALYDQHLAERMAHASGHKLVAGIVRHIEKSDRTRRGNAAYSQAARLRSGGAHRRPAGALQEGRTDVTPARGA